ncbi:hypothetical protein EIL87_14920 [Saccharopolyspora rhizosphaerae]|uniref:Zinc-finger n=1 Tax=Saccharopolyspora rhizosphaerae TaxID=2492662 RepID=A0A426JQI0_9PSEU|nr:zinc finger protein [Saccharopolyspora rhizosphaerae]RRO15357.1 hypothetical protein EIL87_14920 [Saccharopolyspora rhizosphaerae]
MTEHLTHVWRPLPGSRHAFPASALKCSPDEQAESYCGIQVEAARLHTATEIDWIVEPTCSACWEILKNRS